MALFRCCGGGKTQLTEHIVSATDFPNIFKYIDVRDDSYIITDSIVKRIVCTVTYRNGATWSASKINIYDMDGNKLFSTESPTTLDIVLDNVNGIRVSLYSTIADGGLYFSEFKYYT